MNIGENIRKFRKIKNMSAKNLGDAIGCSAQAILQYERGERSPSIEILSKIADELEVSLDTLRYPIFHLFDKIPSFIDFENDKTLAKSIAKLSVPVNTLFQSQPDSVSQPNLINPSLIEKSLINLLLHVNGDTDLPNIDDNSFKSMLQNVCDLIEFELFKISKYNNDTDKNFKKDNLIYKYIISNL